MVEKTCTAKTPSDLGNFHEPHVKKELVMQPWLLLSILFISVSQLSIECM